MYKGIFASPNGRLAIIVDAIVTSRSNTDCAQFLQPVKTSKVSSQISYLSFVGQISDGEEILLDVKICGDAQYTLCASLW